MIDLILRFLDWWDNYRVMNIYNGKATCTYKPEYVPCPVCGLLLKLTEKNLIELHGRPCYGSFTPVVVRYVTTKVPH